MLHINIMHVKCTRKYSIECFYAITMQVFKPKKCRYLQYMPQVLDYRGLLLGLVCREVSKEGRKLGCHISCFTGLSCCLKMAGEGTHGQVCDMSSCCLSRNCCSQWKHGTPKHLQAGQYGKLAQKSKETVQCVFPAAFVSKTQIYNLCNIPSLPCYLCSQACYFPTHPAHYQGGKLCWEECLHIQEEE